MELTVLLLVLGSAVLHASWNTLVKSGGQPWLRMGAVIGTSGLLGCALAPFVPFPTAEVWTYILISAVLHQFYFIGICLGYRFGDLSHVYPVQRGIAPFLVAIGAWVFAGETLSTQGIVGVGVIGLAILSLAVTTTKWPDDAAAMFFAVFTGFTIAAYSVVNGMGARAAEHVTTFIVWLMVVSDIPFGIIAVLINLKRSTGSIRRHLTLGAGGGLLTAMAYALSIWAMTMAPITYVSALRETSVILAAWIGSRLLNEPFGSKRVGAAVFVVLGVVLLQTSGAQ